MLLRGISRNNVCVWIYELEFYSNYYRGKLFDRVLYIFVICFWVILFLLILIISYFLSFKEKMLSVCLWVWFFGKGCGVE